MTYSRLLEIQNKVLSPISDIVREFRDCDDTKAVFMAGYHLGIMRTRLIEELEKELEEGEKDDSKCI